MTASHSAYRDRTPALILASQSSQLSPLMSFQASLYNSEHLDLASGRAEAVIECKQAEDVHG